MVARVVVLASLLFVSVLSSPAFATAPKQVCEIYKELRLVAVGKSAKNSQFEAVVDYLQLKIIGNAESLESEVVTLNKVQSANGVFVAKESFAKSVHSIQYERTILGIRTTFYEIRNGKRRVLSQETDYAQNYQVGQARPNGPLVCFTYAQ